MTFRDVPPSEEQLQKLIGHVLSPPASRSLEFEVLISPFTIVEALAERVEYPGVPWIGVKVPINKSGSRIKSL